MPNQEGRRWLGSTVGILTFLVGIAMLVAVFMWARDLFLMPPAEALQIKPGEELNLNTAGTHLGGVVVKVLLLVVMAIIAGVVASRGIRLYGESASREVRVLESRGVGESGSRDVAE